MDQSSTDRGWKPLEPAGWKPAYDLGPASLGNHNWVALGLLGGDELFPEALVEEYFLEEVFLGNGGGGQIGIEGQTQREGSASAFAAARLNPAAMMMNDEITGLPNLLLSAHKGFQMRGE